MQIGEVIRIYRKKSGMTQEEMADRLGVTTPAVNKWEKGGSNPDIELLAPIARLLHISLDELLSFREDLTEIEIEGIIRTMDEKLNQENFDAVFEWSKGIIHQYPHCNQLIWQIAIMLDARRLVEEITDSEKYDVPLTNWYETVLTDETEELRKQAADALFGFYLRKEQYDKAEEYLTYFSENDPQGKMKRGRLFQARGDKEEACKIYEQILFSEYQIMNAVFSMLSMLTLEAEKIEAEEIETAKYYIEKQGGLAHLFEMGKYHEVSGMLDIVCAEKNVEGTFDVVKEMLQNVNTINGFSTSKLYQHLEFKALKDEFYSDLKEKLVDGFKNHESFGYMKGNVEWDELIKGYCV